MKKTLFNSACWFSSAKVVEIVSLFNSKTIQLRQKSCQIVTFTIFAVIKIHSVTQNVSDHFNVSEVRTFSQQDWFEQVCIGMYMAQT